MKTDIHQFSFGKKELKYIGKDDGLFKNGETYICSKFDGSNYHFENVKGTRTFNDFEVLKTAVFSDCRKYRYALVRAWDYSKPFCLFIGLNPSTANELENDPTLTRCVNYAKSWGYGGVFMANLFAIKDTDSNQMITRENPIGKNNDLWLSKLYNMVDKTICIWGDKGRHLNRSNDIKNILPKLYYLKLNISGEPSHTRSGLSNSLKPTEWKH